MRTAAFPQVRDLLQCPPETLEVRIVEPGTALVDRSYGSVGVPGLTAVTVNSATELQQVPSPRSTPLSAVRSPRC